MQLTINNLTLFNSPKCLAARFPFPSYSLWSTSKYSSTLAFQSYQDLKTITVVTFVRFLLYCLLLSISPCLHFCGVVQCVHWPPKTDRLNAISPSRVVVSWECRPYAQLSQHRWTSNCAKRDPNGKWSSRSVSPCLLKTNITYSAITCVWSYFYIFFSQEDHLVLCYGFWGDLLFHFWFWTPAAVCAFLSCRSALYILKTQREKSRAKMNACWTINILPHAGVQSGRVVKTGEASCLTGTKVQKSCQCVYVRKVRCAQIRVRHLLRTVFPGVTFRIMCDLWHNTYIYLRRWSNQEATQHNQEEHGDRHRRGDEEPRDAAGQ